MRYLIGGFISLLVACNTPSFGVCSEQQVQDKVLVLKSESRVESRSREATVKVFSEREAGTGFGTGTVFNYKGRTVILTAAHVVGGLGNRTTVSDEPAFGFLSIGCSGDKHKLAADKIRAEAVASLFTCLKIMMV